MIVFFDLFCSRGFCFWVMHMPRQHTHIPWAFYITALESKQLAYYCHEETADLWDQLPKQLAIVCPFVFARDIYMFASLVFPVNSTSSNNHFSWFFLRCNNFGHQLVSSIYLFVYVKYKSRSKIRTQTGTQMSQLWSIFYRASLLYISPKKNLYLHTYIDPFNTKH